MSDAPDEVYVWHSGHPDSVQDSGIWTTSREPAKHHALIEYRRADLVGAEIERLRAGLPQELVDRIHERLSLSLSWLTDGVREYSKPDARLLRDILAWHEGGATQ